MDSFQLVLYGNDLAGSQVTCSNSKVKVRLVPNIPNKNYLFANVSVPKEAEQLVFTIKKGRKKLTFDYTFKERRDLSDREYLNPSDLLYLIMPDRFANGDPSNDQVKEMNQTVVDRKEMYERHGGDIQGVIDHLDYLDELGVTALWLNPVLENDQPKESYHGYAQTDLYRIDRRLGSNETYIELIDSCHNRKIKVIKDVVYNHWGSEHWMYKDIPDSSWFHWWDDFTRTSYRATTLIDPHASKKDFEAMTNGWFDYHMPDLDQTNPELANYLIQNSLWWIENANLDGFRIDTYAYSDQQFMADLTETILDEYPGFSIFGETWVHGSFTQSWFTEGQQGSKSFDSHLPSVTDFQSYYAINEALAKDFGWTQGAARLYYTLAADGLYEHPELSVVFLDNHDLSRFMSMCGEDLAKFKCGIGWLMTVRGIPMLYYGTEIGMKNFSDPDGKVREDFPGGWNSDQTNLFSKKERQETKTWDYVSTLTNWRKDNPWLGMSKLTQFTPKLGEYVFARHDDDHTVLVIMNPTDKEIAFDYNRYTELTEDNLIGVDVLTDDLIDLQKLEELLPNSCSIIKLR